MTKGKAQDDKGRKLRMTRIKKLLLIYLNEYEQKKKFIKFRTTNFTSIE